MQFKPITLEDKPTFDSFFKKYPSNISDMTFTNLFAWRESKKYKFAVVDEHLVVRFGNRFLQPIGEEPEKVITKIFSEFNDVSFERVEKKIAMKVKDNFKVEEDRDMFDYVYSVQELIELKGRKFEAKRNLVKQFEQYDLEVCKLTEDNMADFLKLQRQWCELRGCDDNDLLVAENDAIMEALKHFKEFNLCGICVRKDNIIAGFAIGERLNENTYVEHFEKGDTKYKGVYQFMLREFAKAISKKAEFLNREQDLGIPGLRKSKESYNPVKMVEKYRIKK
jgi:hypothetical protein